MARCIPPCWSGSLPGVEAPGLQLLFDFSNALPQPVRFPARAQRPNRLEGRHQEKRAQKPPDVAEPQRGSQRQQGRGGDAKGRPDPVAPPAYIQAGEVRPQIGELLTQDGSGPVAVRRQLGHGELPTRASLEAKRPALPAGGAGRMCPE
jgi:hypothetical protein